MVDDASLLLHITETVDQLGQAKCFSCIDMAMGYHQIEVDQKDIDQTAFSTKQGHWAFKRISFSLQTAAATFKE